MSTTQRATKWSVTCNLLNIKKETVESCISTARQQGWTVLGQIEKGTEGTEHYQLAVATPHIRFSAVKKVFPTAHIEKCKDWNALVKYCNKEDTRVEKIVQAQYVTFQMVRDKFFEYLINDGNVNLTDEQHRISEWDTFIQLSLREKIECDLVGVNPQYRSCIMKYWDAYIYLAIHRQQDSQTTEVILPTISIPDANLEEEEISEEEEGSETDGSSSPF